MCPNRERNPTSWSLGRRLLLSHAGRAATVCSRGPALSLRGRVSAWEAEGEWLVIFSLLACVTAHTGLFIGHRSVPAASPVQEALVPPMPGDKEEKTLHNAELRQAALQRLDGQERPKQPPGAAGPAERRASAGREAPAQPVSARRFVK